MLYIRHGEKQYKNGRSSDFCLDPGITQVSKQFIKEKFIELALVYGIPNKIISSPYLRARETADIASSVIMEIHNVFIKPEYDPIIGEYLGHQNHRNIKECLREETLMHNPIPPENWNQYCSRIKEHFIKAEENVWYITHGIVIKSISNLYETKIKHVNYVGGIRVENGIVTII